MPFTRLWPVVIGDAWVGAGPRPRFHLRQLIDAYPTAAWWDTSRSTSPCTRCGSGTTSAPDAVAPARTIHSPYGRRRPLGSKAYPAGSGSGVGRLHMPPG